MLGTPKATWTAAVEATAGRRVDRKGVVVPGGRVVGEKLVMWMRDWRRPAIVGSFRDVDGVHRAVGGGDLKANRWVGLVSLDDGKGAITSA